MEVDPAEWQSRLEAVSLKQLILLYEMSNLIQSIGSVEGQPNDPNLELNTQSHHWASFRRSDTRVELGQRIRKHMENTYRRIHNEEFEDPWALAKEDGFLMFVVLWDHWQPPFEDLVYRRPFEL